MAFGIDDAVASVSTLLGKAVDRIWPDPTVNAQIKADLAKQEADGSLKEYLAQTGLIQAQIDVDKAEASSGNAYAADARPTVMYAMCGLFVWSIGVAPFVAWALSIWYPAVKPLPALDTSMASTILIGLLGLGGMHTYENTRP